MCEEESNDIMIGDDFLPSSFLLPMRCTCLLLHIMFGWDNNMHTIKKIRIGARQSANSSQINERVSIVVDRDRLIYFFILLWLGMMSCLFL